MPDPEIEPVWKALHLLESADDCEEFAEAFARFVRVVRNRHLSITREVAQDIIHDFRRRDHIERFEECFDHRIDPGPFFEELSRPEIVDTEELDSATEDLLDVIERETGYSRDDGRFTCVSASAADDLEREMDLTLASRKEDVVGVVSPDHDISDELMACVLFEKEYE